MHTDSRSSNTSTSKTSHRNSTLIWIHLRTCLINLQYTLPTVCCAAEHYFARWLFAFHIIIFCRIQLSAFGVRCLRTLSLASFLHSSMPSVPAPFSLRATSLYVRYTFHFVLRFSALALRSNCSSLVDEETLSASQKIVGMLDECIVHCTKTMPLFEPILIIQGMDLLERGVLDSKRRSRCGHHREPDIRRQSSLPARRLGSLQNFVEGHTLEIFSEDTAND